MTVEKKTTISVQYASSGTSYPRHVPENRYQDPMCSLAKSSPQVSTSAAAFRQVQQWQSDLNVCNSPAHKIQILLASGRDFELSKLHRLWTTKRCEETNASSGGRTGMSLQEYRAVREDVQKAYNALAAESSKLLREAAAASIDCSDAQEPGDVALYRQLVSLFSTLFPWSDTVLFDLTQFPILLQRVRASAKQQKERLSPPSVPVKEVRWGEPNKPQSPPPPAGPPLLPKIGASGLGVMQSFQHIQGVAHQKIRQLMTSKQARMAAAQQALAQWRLEQQKKAAAEAAKQQRLLRGSICSCRSSGDCSSSHSPVDHEIVPRLASSSLSSSSSDNDENEEDRLKMDASQQQQNGELPTTTILW